MEKTKYKYFVTVLKSIFQVSVIYFTIIFLTTFYLHSSLHFTQIFVLSTSYIFKLGSFL